MARQVFRPFPWLLAWVAVWGALRLITPEVTHASVVGLVLAAVGLCFLLVEYARSTDLNITRFVRDMVSAQVALVLVTLILAKSSGWQLLDAFVALVVLADAVLSTYVSYCTAMRNWAGNTQVSVGGEEQGAG